MARDWGIVVEDARDGYARISAPVSDKLLNGYGTTHGGALFTLADTAFAYACSSHDRYTVAHSASINFLGPARPGDQLIIEAHETMLAGRSGAYAVTVRTAQGRPIATFHGLSRTVGGSILNEDDHG